MILKMTNAPLYLRKMQADCADVHWTADKDLATHLLDPFIIARLLKDIRDIDCEVIE